MVGVFVPYYYLCFFTQLLQLRYMRPKFSSFGLRLVAIHGWTSMGSIHTDMSTHGIRALTDMDQRGEKRGGGG